MILKRVEVGPHLAQLSIKEKLSVRSGRAGPCIDPNRAELFVVR